MSHPTTSTTKAVDWNAITTAQETKAKRKMLYRKLHERVAEDSSISYQGIVGTSAFNLTERFHRLGPTGCFQAANRVAP